MENYFCGSKEVELVLVEDENDFIDPLETDIFLDSEELQMDENKLRLNDDVYSDCDLSSSGDADQCESTILPIITTTDFVKTDIKNANYISSCSSFNDNDSNDIYIATSNVKSETKVSKSDNDKQNEKNLEDSNPKEINKIGNEPCNALDSNHHGLRKIDDKRTRNGANKMKISDIIEEKPIRKKCIRNNTSEMKQEKPVEFRVRPDPKRVSLYIFSNEMKFAMIFVLHRKEQMPDLIVKGMQYQKKPNIMKRTTKNF